MKKPIIISFYTNDWQYPYHAEKLKNDCIRLKLDYDIRELPSAGGYLQNTRLKPQYILDCLIKHKQPVLWVDVDGSILKPPRHFYEMNDSIDIAAKRMPKSRDRTWHVGTMWFNYNDKVISFLQQWVSMCKTWSDESALEDLIRINPVINIVDIPASYFVLERPGLPPSISAVIFHRSSKSQTKLQQLADKTKIPKYEQK